MTGETEKEMKLWGLGERGKERRKSDTHLLEPVLGMRSGEEGSSLRLLNRICKFSLKLKKTKS